MESPSRIDFNANGRVVFTMTEPIPKIIVRSKSDHFEKQDQSLSISGLDIDVIRLTDIYVKGVLIYTYSAVDPFDTTSIVAKTNNVFGVFVDEMSVAPATIEVDAPVTIDAANAEILAYAILSVTGAGVVDLADGVDQSSTPVPIPAGATGARLDVNFTSTGAKLIFASNGITPANTPSEVGDYVVENKTSIYLGRTPQSSDAVSELAEFKAIMNTSKTATVYITYYKMS